MADRPRDPRDGGPDFDWLYGKQKGAAAKPGNGSSRGPAKPEATRVMPVQQRPSRQTGPADVPPGPPRRPAAPPPEPGAGRPRGRRPRVRTVRRLVLLLLVAWIAALVIVPVLAWNGIDKVAFEPKGERPADQPGSTYLLVGSDSRAGLSKAQRRKLATGDAAGQRTDTIKLLHTGDGPNTLLTIPRDSIVDIPGRGTSKINAAFAWGGPKLLVRTIEANTGIRVDGYVEIGMGGLVNLVDGVGGIEICPKQRMRDPLAGLDVRKGCQEADGVKALAYARSRHAHSTGDLGRGESQTEVIGQIGSRAARPTTLLNPFKLHSLGSAVGDGGIKVGEGMSVIDAAKFALAFRSIGSSGLSCGVPIRDFAVNWDEERSQQMFGFIAEDQTQNIPEGLCTPTGLPKSVTG